MSDRVKESGILLLEDAANWSTIRAASHLRPLPLVQLSRPLFASPESIEGGEQVKSLMETMTRGSLFHYEGPSFPTLAEVEVAKKIEADVISITDLSLVYVANQIGFSTIGVSILTSSSPGFASIPLCDQAVSRISLILSCPSVPSLCPSSGLPVISSFAPHQVSPFFPPFMIPSLSIIPD